MPRRRSYSYSQSYSSYVPATPAGPENDLCKHFTSPRALATWMRAERLTTAWRPLFGSSYAAQPAALDGIRILESGSDANVQAAKDLLTKFQENVEVPSHKWETRMVGAFPNVPAFLAGEPETMWAREEITSDRSPLRIWMGLTSSAGITPAQLTQRGCVLAAFAIALSEKRPVYISPYVNNSDGYTQHALVSWDIHTSPLVLAELLGCVSSSQVTRNAGLLATYLLNPQTSGHWSKYEESETEMRRRLNAAPADMYLPPIHLYDPMLADPIKWLQENIARYGSDDADNTNDWMVN